MPIWELQPIDPRDDNWRASTYCGRAVVRAKDKDAARGVASGAFAQIPSLEGHKIPIDPWLYEKTTTCERLKNTEYSEDGPEELLEPDPAKYAPHLRG